MENVPKQNTGYLEGSATKNLWIAGDIPYEVILPSGDWRPFLPVGEKQRPALVDVMACVTFSCESSLEIQEKQQTGVEPNWSDRFIAKLSGTTPQGNYLDKVADTVRKIGLVKEEEWPTPPNFSWNSYYAEIPQEVINKAVIREIMYGEVVPGESELRHHLKQCPIQIVIPVPHPNHAVVAVAIEGSTVYYFDSYSPFLKTINISKIHYALKIVLKGNMNQTKPYLAKDGKTILLVTPMAMDFENFKKQAGVEGIAVPDPIPPASSL